MKRDRIQIFIAVLVTLDFALLAFIAVLELRWFSA